MTWTGVELPSEIREKVRRLARLELPEAPPVNRSLDRLMRERPDGRPRSAEVDVRSSGGFEIDPAATTYRRPVKPADTVRHGTPSAFTNDKCRCESCRQAWAAYQRERRAKRKELLIPA